MMLDAPVSGGVPGAEARTLSFMVKSIVLIDSVLVLVLNLNTQNCHTYCNGPHILSRPFGMELTGSYP